MRFPAALSSGSVDGSSHVAGAQDGVTTQAAKRSRLAGVDGLRAIAALWVLSYHIGAFTSGHVPIPGANLFLRSGSTGVSLFLVLSGFCLYLPFAGGRQHRFRTREFFVRRCRRLMPAYLASLALVLVLYLGAGPELGYSSLSPATTVWLLVTHVTMTHTLFPTTFYALNGAYWSLGLEWQLYLMLPLLIWGIIRFGIPRTLSAAVLCNVVYGVLLALAVHGGYVPPHGLLAQAVLPNQLPGRWAEFILGMLAAELYTTNRVHLWARHAWWVIPVFVPVAIVISGLPLSHMVYGVVFFSLLCLVLSENNIMSKTASWKPLAAIGTMSYSLYLVHQPIVQGLAYAARDRAHFTPDQAFVLVFALVPFILVVAWLLFVAVERHTLTSGRKTPVAAPISANGNAPIPQPDGNLHLPVRRPLPVADASG